MNTEKPDNVIASQSGTSRVYIVEARASVPIDGNHVKVDGLVLTKDWQRLFFKEGEGPFNVHVGKLLPPGARENQFIDFEAADAMAAWFRACVDDKGYRAIGVDTRIVSVDFKYSYTATRAYEGEPVNSLELQTKRFKLEHEHEEAAK